MNQSIPPELTFNYVRPKGFASQFTEWVVNPMGQQNTFSPDQILRYEVNLNTGYFDPYRSYFDIVVQTDIPCGSMQIDSSAFSFISQSLITGIMTANELQRIPQYDQIGAITVQMGYQPIFSAGKEYMGLGRSFFTGCAKAPTSAVSSSNNTLAVVANSGQYTSSFADYGTNTFNPCFINRQQSTIGCQDVGFLSNGANVTRVPGKFSKYTQVQSNYNNLPLSIGNVLGNSPSFVSQLNAGVFLTSVNNQINQHNMGLSIPRIQYTMATLDTRYPDSYKSLVRNAMSSNTMISNYSPNSPYVKYALGPQQKIKIKYYDLSQTQQPQGTSYQVNNTCGLHGFLNPYSPELSIGLQQPFISPTVNQCGMKNGKITSSWMPVTQKRFVVPFLSSVMGALIPQSSYSLLPIEAFRVYIQLTLNKFAMFSSGFNDRTPYDTVGMQYPIQRRFYFKRFNYVLQLYYFQQNQMKNYLQRSLAEGFVFSTQPIMLTSNYVVPNQLALRGSWTINTPQTFLTQLIVRFIDNRYLKFPFLRKNYTLSCNISSFQIKFDTKWYPPQPIIGNAGNPQFLDSTGNVQPYLQMLLKTKDSLFSRTPSGITNAYNFSINSRIFSPNVTTPLLDPTINLNQQYSNCTIKTQDQINTHTALGFPSWHQNRVCGRAIYIYNFETLGHSKGLANGLVVGNSRPFELILNTSVQQPFQSEIGMYIFTRSHAVVQVSKKGVQVMDY